MFCPKCGAENPDGSTNCASCGSPMGEQAGQAPTAPPPEAAAAAVPAGVEGADVPDFLVHNIIATVVGGLCCMGSCFPVPLILGIIGIVFASKAKNALAGGDIATAESSSNTAKIMFYIALACLVLGLIIVVVLFSLGIISEVMSGNF